MIVSDGVLFRKLFVGAVPDFLLISVGPEVVIVGVIGVFGCHRP